MPVDGVAAVAASRPGVVVGVVSLADPEIDLDPLSRFVTPWTRFFFFFGSSYAHPGMKEST